MAVDHPQVLLEHPGAHVGCAALLGAAILMPVCMCMCMPMCMCLCMGPVVAGRVPPVYSPLRAQGLPRSRGGEGRHCMHVWGRTVYAHIPCRCTRLSPKSTRPWRTTYRPTLRPTNASSMRGPTRLPSCGACSLATRPRRRRPRKRCPHPSVAADRRVGGRHAAYIRWLAAARSAGVALRHLRY